MDAIQMLLTRRSCRSFTDEQISDEDLRTIIDCGLNAPSGNNLQNTKIVVVQEKEKVKQLSDLNNKIWQKNADPFYGAPTACLILAPKNAEDVKESWKLNPVKDGSLVIGAMQDAAFALGIGSCWINRCKEMLELPEGQKFLEELGLQDYFGVGICILGIPAVPSKPKRIKPERVIYYSTSLH